MAKRETGLPDDQNCTADAWLLMVVRHLDRRSRRLQTDYLDLWRVYELPRTTSDPDWVFEGDGKGARRVKRSRPGRVSISGSRDTEILDHPEGAGDAYTHGTPARSPINRDGTRSTARHYHVGSPVCREKRVAAIGMKSSRGGWPGDAFSKHECRGQRTF